MTNKEILIKEGEIQATIKENKKYEIETEFNLSEKEMPDDEFGTPKEAIEPLLMFYLWYFICEKVFGDCPECGGVKSKLIGEEII